MPARAASAPSPPLALLRRLRELIARPARNRQARLDRLVRFVASAMVADVCSLYLRAKQERGFELAASEGLHPRSVGKTKLAWNEGLVGDVALHARPLAISEAKSHPAFAPRPETGEEAYASFLGVPILREGDVVGVMVVQNRRTARYGEDEVELLQTLTMIAAELLALGAAEGGAEGGGAPAPSQRHLRGRGWVQSVALGHIVLHQPPLKVDRLIAEDTASEHKRLDDSIYALQREVDRLAGRSEDGHREIFETYRMFANDRSWLNRMHEAVDTGLTAEASVERVQEGLRAQFLHQKDPYLRARLHDMDDLAIRLLRHLTGTAGAKSADALPKDAVLAARNMGAAALLDYEHSSLRGVLLEEGAALAHITIVARALNIALIGQLPGLLTHAREGDVVIADGTTGDAYLNPEPNLVRLYREKLRFRASRQQRYRRDAAKPAQTKDGVDVNLLMTAGLLADLPHLDESGASGIGLFRTELHFMISSALPSLAAQSKVYRQVLAAAGKRPVMFRSLDIGGDKILPYMRRIHESAKGENPALGWRAIRIGLDRPALLRYQIRALLQSAAQCKARLNLLLPLVSDKQEFHQAAQLIAREKARAKKLGQPLPPDVKIGVMIEVPSLLWQLDGLLPLVDFISIGSNDLFQFLFAQDRTDPRLSGRYDELHPSALRVLAHILRAAREHDCPVSLCGEMAASPLKALALIGLGFRDLALPAHAIGPVKAALRKARASQLSEIMEQALASTTPLAAEKLADYADKTRISLT